MSSNHNNGNYNSIPIFIFQFLNHSSLPASEARRAYRKNGKLTPESSDDNDSISAHSEAEVNNNEHVIETAAAINKRLSSSSLDRESNDRISISQSPFHQSESNLSQMSRHSLHSSHSITVNVEDKQDDSVSQSSVHSHNDIRNIEIEPTVKLRHDSQPTITNNQMLPPSNNIYSVEVTNLTPDIKHAEIEEYFQEFGTVMSVGQISRKTNHLDGRIRLFTTVALKLNGTIDQLLQHQHAISGHAVEIHHHSKPSASNEKYKIIVSGINKTITRAMLEEKFSRYGEIKNVEFDNIYFPTSCCITFADASSYEGAISKRHSQIDGSHRLSIRPMTVKTFY